MGSSFLDFVTAVAIFVCHFFLSFFFHFDLYPFREFPEPELPVPVTECDRNGAAEFREGFGQRWGAEPGEAIGATRLGKVKPPVPPKPSHLGAKSTLVLRPQRTLVRTDAIRRLDRTSQSPVRNPEQRQEEQEQQLRIGHLSESSVVEWPRSIAVRALALDRFCHAGRQHFKEAVR